MKPLKPYPGHRGKKPVRTRRDPISEMLANAQAQTMNAGLQAQTYRNPDFNAQLSAYGNPAQNVFNGLMSSSTNTVNGPWYSPWPEASADRLAFAGSSRQGLSESTTPAGLLARLAARWAGLWARFSGSRAQTNPRSAISPAATPRNHRMRPLTSCALFISACSVVNRRRRPEP